MLMFLDCQLPVKWSLISSPEWDFHSSAPQDICHSAKAESGPREGMMSCLGMLGEQAREEMGFWIRTRAESAASHGLCSVLDALTPEITI